MILVVGEPELDVPTTVLQVMDAALKSEMWSRLQDGRATMLSKVRGLSEYDLRRPLTPSGTNLLGLVKHLAGEEYAYLGEVFDRPPAISPTWFRDDPATEIDMWATPDESIESEESDMRPILRRFPRYAQGARHRSSPGTA